MRKLRKFAVPFVALLAATALAACGSDDDDGDAGGGAEGGGKTGGSITISQTSQPDFLDPALSYTVNGWEPMWLVYSPLIGYKHAEGEEGAELIPYAAEALPEVSEDGRTYSLKLRDGLKYSDGTPAKASDFERTIQRVLNLESGGSAFYLKIDGAQEYVDGKEAEADIPGIETDDATGEITIKLTEPDGSFSNVLAMNFAGLVPGDTPFENLSKNPPPGLGQYQITKSVPNREFVMERNPNFSIPGIPKGNVDRITTKIIKSAARQAQDVIGGKLDYMQDPPPADLKPEVTQKYGDRYEEIVTVSTYYFWMNQNLPPFDDPKAREAVNVGIDKPALARIFAGELAPGCSFLPPGMPGYDEALDVAECPFGDPNEAPDLERAKQLLGESGYDGSTITIWGNNDDPTDKITEAYADMLRKIGFKTEVKILDGGVYFQTIGNERTKNLHTGFANWFQDFPHPSNFMFLVDGASIQPTNNQNFGNVDDPEINQILVEANKAPDLNDEVAGQYAEANRQVVEEFHVAPYGHRKLATFVSERMDFENCTQFHPVYNNNYASFCLK
ncbi:MAG TPA: ABC transporter substrate-binding protein [Thermoleophilaceae bacterium]|nr:ABC transporter substrate-binding protein [Thermoleophilaceae bacterium]